jgi:hypothetical protein
VNLSFKECGESLKLMKNGKSPGSDGFTVDFYKFFWKDIILVLLFFGHFILIPTSNQDGCQAKNRKKGG